MKKSLLSSSLFFAIGLCAVASIATTFISNNKTVNSVHAESPLKALTGSNDNSKVNGTNAEPVTIANVLPDDFPVLKDYGWSNGNGSYIYCDSTTFYVDNGQYILTVDKTTVLTNSSTNYVYYYDQSTAFYFNNLEDGKMTSFFVSCPTASNFYGTYTPSHVHSYGDVSASWNDDQVTLTVECFCGDVQTDTFTATYQQVSYATCTNPEQGKYVLTIAEGIFAGTYESPVFSKGEELGHDPRKVNGQPATCTIDGWRDAYFCSTCNEYFEDENCQNEIEDYQIWKTSDGRLPAHHDLIKLDEKPATCTEEGYKERYKCQICELFFEDANAQNLIGEDTDVFNWVNNEGKIDPLGHHGVKQDGKAPTTTEAGYKDYYKCDRCNKLFTEIECINEIVDLEAWKTGAGKIEKLSEPETKNGELSGGAIAGITVGAVAGAALISYAVMFVVYAKTGKGLKFLSKSFDWLKKLFKMK